MTDRDKHVDESWKENISREKEHLSDPCGCGKNHHSCGDDLCLSSSGQEEDQDGVMEVNFLNYISSLIFQALIFLGEIPNPMDDNKTGSNPAQAKLLIDTLILLRDKTSGNLTEEEDKVLSHSLSELQMKYVQLLQNPAGSTGA